MYKIAVFDMDGTILDTIEDLRAAANHALAALGFPVLGIDAFRPCIGSGITMLLKRCLPYGHQIDGNIEKMAMLYKSYYAEHATDFTKVYTGITEVILKMREAGIKIAVLSNKPHEFTVSLAQHYFPGMINVAYGQRDDIPRKPNPAALDMILDEFGFTTADCLYIGDSDVDMQTAKNAGVTSVGVLWGYCPREEIEAVGASFIIDKAEDLLTIALDKQLACEYTMQ